MWKQFGRYAHCSAAINGHLDVVTYLLEECPHPIDINAIDEVRGAWRERERDCARRLTCECSVAVGCVQYGATCLHWAASKGRKEVIQYLCMKGIDVHVTSYVRTPCTFCCARHGN